MKKLGTIILYFFLALQSCMLWLSNKEIERLNTEIKSIQEQCEELKVDYDLFKDLTNKEFISTWRSFARVRANFKAIPYNRLTEGDIYNGEEDETEKLAGN